MVELRKRPAPPPSTTQPATKRRTPTSNGDKKNKDSINSRETEAETEASPSINSNRKSKTRVFGDKNCLDGPLADYLVPGHGGKKTTLKTLAEDPDGNSDIIIKKDKDDVGQYFLIQLWQPTFQIISEFQRHFSISWSFKSTKSINIEPQHLLQAERKEWVADTHHSIM